MNSAGHEKKSNRKRFPDKTETAFFRREHPHCSGMFNKILKIFASHFTS